MNSEAANFIIKQFVPDEVARRYDNRTGFDLVTYREVGLPVYRITVQALILLRKPIPPIEEFVLKTINAGFCLEEKIIAFLGLEQPIVRDAMINLTRSDDIYLCAPASSRMQVWTLTTKGKRTLSDARNIVPEERSFTINFDGLLRQPRWYGRFESHLLRSRDVREQEILEIPSFPAKPPQLAELKLKDVDAIIRQVESKSKYKRNEERNLLALKAIERHRERFFQPALALIYQAKEGDEVQVAFAIDGRLSTEHEAAFARANGIKKLRILEALQESTPRKLAEKVLGKEFVAQASVIEEQVHSLKEEVSSAQAQLQAQIEITRKSIEQAETDEEKKVKEQQIKPALERIEQLQTQLNLLLASSPIRWLKTYEHRPLLEQALRDSQKRLLIISPWIRANAANKWLIQQLENLLERGVKVFIGYGLGEEDKKNRYDIQAEEAIQKLASQYKKNFILKRLGDTHVKTLISDTKFAVVGSFNWLSFKGDPNRTFRDERSTFVSDRQKVNELFDIESDRFND